MKRHYILPIFLPQMGCRETCIFCNQRVVSGQVEYLCPEAIEQEILAKLAWFPKGFPIEVAFYGGSFTALPLAVQEAYLSQVKAVAESTAIQSIRLSTRPDCINEKILSLLKQYGVKTIELGVQSLDNHVLHLAGRSHRKEHVIKSLNLIKEFDFHSVLQLMPGLPDEDWSSLFDTVRGVIALAPDQVRIYPTLVLAGTELGKWYNQGRYQPLNLDEAVKRTAWMKETFSQIGIQVIRLGLQASKDLDSAQLIAGPYHPAFGELVEGQIWLNKIYLALENIGVTKGTVTIHYPSPKESQIKGQKSSNLLRLHESYPYVKFVLLSSNQYNQKINLEFNNVYYQLN